MSNLSLSANAQVRLGSRDALLAARIVLFILAVPLLLRLPLKRLLPLLDNKRSKTPDLKTIEKTIYLTDTMTAKLRPLLHSYCLSKSLTLFYFLRRAGVDLELCFGMGEVKGKLTGHCWLLKEGVPFLEQEDPRSLFKEMFRYSSYATH